MASNRMIPLTCKAQPLGDIRTRQPKSPGQNPSNMPDPMGRAPRVMLGESVATFGNALTKSKDSNEFRCCRCAGKTTVHGDSYHVVR